MVSFDDSMNRQWLKMYANAYKFNKDKVTLRFLWLLQPYTLKTIKLFVPNYEHPFTCILMALAIF